MNLKHNWKKFTIKTFSGFCILMLKKKKKLSIHQNATSFRQGPLTYLLSRKIWKFLTKAYSLTLFYFSFPVLSPSPTLLYDLRFLWFPPILQTLVSLGSAQAGLPPATVLLELTLSFHKNKPGYCNFSLITSGYQGKDHKKGFINIYPNEHAFPFLLTPASLPLPKF